MRGLESTKTVHTGNKGEFQIHLGRYEPDLGNLLGMTYLGSPETAIRTTWRQGDGMFDYHNSCIESHYQSDTGNIPTRPSSFGSSPGRPIIIDDDFTETQRAMGHYNRLNEKSSRALHHSAKRTRLPYSTENAHQAAQLLQELEIKATTLRDRVIERKPPTHSYFCGHFTTLDSCRKEIGW